mmetsp:Transcript_25184/g.33735  ORF Transcript_25184/g.33735 Transcript_25184/m.33735 type:complete len:206 (+) Transcript_25184:1160-1777(+)
MRKGENDTVTSELIFLTNASLLTGTTKNDIPSFARLTTQSYIAKIDLNFLKQLQEGPDDEQGITMFSDPQVQRFKLYSSSSQMAIWRVFSHNFPYVDAVESENSEGLTFHLFGKADQPAMSMSFLLVDADGDTFHRPSFFHGHIVMRKDGEQVPIQGKLAFGDKSGLTFKEGEARVSKKSGEEFTFKTSFVKAETTKWNLQTSSY